jgi:plastocyanin
MRTSLVIAALATLAGLGAGAPREARAQALTERTPNLDDVWTGSTGTLHFNFLHRFGQSGPPLRKVSSAPTFLLALPPFGGTLLAARYATNSEVAAGVPNEWEFTGRWRPLRQDRGAPFDGGMEAGYNLAAESVDGALTVSRTLGALRLMGTGRWLSSAGGGEGRVAAGGGAVLTLRRSVALAGDVVIPFAEGADMVWGAGLQLRIPTTPHTLSLQATNTNSSTLQGATLAAPRVRYGFEFTIPITPARYFGGGSDRAVGADWDAPLPPVAEPVRADIAELAYRPATLTVVAGTVIEWVNRDPLMHTVTADGGAFDSGEIQPGGRWAHRFDTPGRFSFHCTPHPFMRGVVIVTEAP